MKTLNKILAATLLLLWASTALPQKLSKKDLAPMYSEYNFTTFEPVVYHVSDEVTRIYANIQLHHFQYAPDAEGRQEARFSIAFNLYSSYNDRAPLESRTENYSDTLFAGQEMQMAADLDVHAAYPGTYVLTMELTDLNKPENKVMSVADISKTSHFSSQNFYVEDEEGFPVFKSFIFQDQYFRVRYNKPDTGSLQIRYYNREFPIAKPPFALDKNMTFTLEPDSFYTVSLVGGVTDLLELPWPGIYHIQADPGHREGLTLYRFDEGFPDVNIPAMALAPLRYLTTEAEFKRLLSYQNYKVAVDSFWLERASQNTERAKNMIKKFYQRVVDVNLLFSSYLEGWKTDRGLIYIIYGPPSEVYRRDGEEEWVYGERGNPMSISFYFLKVENPFTDNDYSLQRSSIYQTSWYIAIENWRR